MIEKKNKLNDFFYREWSDPKYKKRDYLLKKICLEKNRSISDAIKNMNKSALQIVVVLNKKKYLGVVTDGDIRRGILKKIPLDKNIEDITRKKSFVVGPDATRTDARRIMDEKRVQHLPIVTKKGFFVGLHLNDEFFSTIRHQNPVVIMAGGFGKRLRPYTAKIPKPMLTYKNKPILEHILKKVKRDGFQNIYISVHYLANKIKNYFKNGSDIELNIKYLNEKKPMGTIGALGLLKEKKTKPIIVCNGDLLHRINIFEMLKFHNRSKSFATMAVKDYKVNNPFGVVNTIGSRINGFKEKPIKRYYVNAGIYIFSPKVLKYLDNKTRLDIPDLFKLLIKKKKKSIIYPVYENWIDIGNLSDYKKIKKGLPNF